ncbi:MAG: MFS transporter permease [Thermoplasmata archaeon]
MGLMRNFSYEDKLFMSEFAIITLVFAAISVYAVSLTFVINSAHIPSFYLGMFFAVALLSFFVLNPISNEYIVRYGNLFSLPISVLSMAISFVLVYISQNVLVISLSIIILSLSFTMFYNSAVKRGEKFVMNVPLTYFSAASGSFAGLILSSFFRGPVYDMYAYFSIILLIMGLLTIFFITKKSQNKPEKHDVLSIMMRPFYVMEKVNRSNKKLLLLADSLNEVFLAISVGSAFPFIFATGIDTGMARNEIFAVTAFSGIIAILAILLYNIFRNEKSTMYYPAKNVIVTVALFLFFMMSQYSFIAAILICSLLPASYLSSDNFLKLQFPEDFNYKEITSFLRNPIMIISPIMGMIMWIVGRHTLFTMAIAFSILSFAVTIIVIENAKFFGISKQTIRAEE